MDNDSSQSPASEEKFSLAVTLDRDRFLRYTCPSCGLDFKLPAADGDLAYLLAPALERMGAELGLSLSSMEASDSVPPKGSLLTHCPYCNHESNPSSMLTDELRRYLHRWILRVYVLPRLHKTLGSIANSGGSQSQGGFLSISFSLEYSRGSLPPRPIYGPDVADMTIISLLCCSNRIKVLDRLIHLSLCPFCQSEIVLP